MHATIPHSPKLRQLLPDTMRARPHLRRRAGHQLEHHLRIERHQHLAVDRRIRRSRVRRDDVLPAGGFEHVAAYLAEFDISDFDPKAPPPQTSAWWDIVNANLAPEDADLANAIDALGRPKALTIKQLIAVAKGAFAEWLSERRSRRAIPHRLERCGYVAVRSDAKDGLWVVGDCRQAIYANSELSSKDRYAAAEELK